MDQQASWNETFTYLMCFSTDVPTLCKTISFTKWPGIPICVPQLLTRALFNSFIHSIPFHQALMVFSGKTAKQHTSSCQISVWRPIRDHLFGTTAIFLSLLCRLQLIFVRSPSPPPSMTNTGCKAPQRMCAIFACMNDRRRSRDDPCPRESQTWNSCPPDMHYRQYQHNYYNNQNLYTHYIHLQCACNVIHDHFSTLVT